MNYRGNPPKRPITMPLGQSSIRDRIRLALALLSGKPVIYRVGFENADVYTRETIWATQFHLCDSNLHWLDKDGTTIRPGYEPTIFKDWHAQWRKERGL